ncbi:hypothetical protein SHO565_63900 [Streptomyces sp. HO565]
MPHVDSTHLVELALGNGVSPHDASAWQHIAVCKLCGDDLSRMTRVVTAARAVEERDLSPAPPERVWRRITAELTDTTEPTPPSSSTPLHGLPAGPPFSGRPRRTLATRHRTACLACCLLTGALFVWWRIRRGPKPSGSAAEAQFAGRSRPARAEVPNAGDRTSRGSGRSA